MRLTMPASCRQFGPVCIMQQIDVLELASRPRPPTVIKTCPMIASEPAASETSFRNRGLKTTKQAHIDASSTLCFSNEALETVLTKMVIIVPCKDENPKTIRSVLSGIPADCAVVLVSNCADGYDALSDVLQAVCRYGREAVLVHQKYQGAAAAFKAVGVPELLESPPAVERIRDGKGEGMYLGIAVARTFFPEREYVGFVDADNQVPGSVNEYCRVYAAGFNLSHHYMDAGEEQVMVRISWKSKPKVRGGQISYEEPEGRSSKVVNSWLNRLFAKPFGDESKFITTGNAGEHAMTMNMALSSRWANGYAIETYQFMDPFLRPASHSGRVDGQIRDNSSVTSDNDGTVSDSDTDSGISIDSTSSFDDTELIDDLTFELGDVENNYDLARPTHADQCATVGGTPVGGTPERVSYMDRVVGVSEPLGNGQVAAGFKDGQQGRTGKSVRILQIKTLNPHFHRQGDDLHILRMWAAGLGAIWHNLTAGTVIPGIDRSTIEEIRSEMVEYAMQEGGLAVEEELPRPRVYPSMDHVDFDTFKKIITHHRYRKGFGAPLFFGVNN
ncbi:mannosyl-3-phosphoglycerate synthase [Cladorrhinum sp. PSN332]|nr:mannosyl-3-phosphoglycerate synthase [Cladorrhinum sp. PSN332]